MREGTWTDAEHDFLRENYKKLSYREIGKQLGRTEFAVKARAGVLGICVSRKWPDDHIAILRRDYPDKTAAEVAANLGRDVIAVWRMANTLGLKKSEAFLASEKSGRLTRENCWRGTAARFERGMAPWNKGKKTGPAHPNCKRTQFQKGQQPHNTLPVGFVGPRTDGYLKIKIAEPNVWEFLHHHVWEQHHGPVPDGMFVYFKNGDRTNCDIDNLALETQTEHCLRNSLWKFPEEVIPAMAALADLKRQIRLVKKAQEVVRD